MPAELIVGIYCINDMSPIWENPYARLWWHSRLFDTYVDDGRTMWDKYGSELFNPHKRFEDHDPMNPAPVVDPCPPKGVTPAIPKYEGRSAPPPEPTSESASTSKRTLSSSGSAREQPPSKRREASSTAAPASTQAPYPCSSAPRRTI